MWTRGQAPVFPCGDLPRTLVQQMLEVWGGSGWFFFLFFKTAVACIYPLLWVDLLALEGLGLLQSLTRYVLYILETKSHIVFSF